jgi:hypothetical protein
MATMSPTPAAPSPLVTVVAWLGIVVSGGALLAALLYNLVFTFVFPAEELQRALEPQRLQGEIPAPAAFLFGHLRVLLLVALAATAALLAAAIALLRRRHWARRVFIGVFALGALAGLGGVLLPLALPGSTALSPPAPQPVFAPGEPPLLLLALAAVFSALFLWLIRKFLSAPVRAEFT